MSQYIAGILFFMVVAVLMALALHFSGYKRRKNSCSCGKNVDSESLEGSSSCGSCDSHGSSSCSCEAQAH